MQPNKQHQTKPDSRLPRMLLVGALGLLMGASGVTLLGPAAADGHGLPPVSTCMNPIGGIPIEDNPLALWDYGDAPDSADNSTYTTLYAGGGNPDGFFPTLEDTSNSIWPGQPGARHRNVDVAWLGDVDLYFNSGETETLMPGDLLPTLERDADSFPDDDVTTTNLDSNSATPDHDGRDNGLVPAMFNTHDTEDLSFRVSTSSGLAYGFVNVLVDWDFNGRWSGADANGAPEWAVVNHPVSVPAQSSQVFTAPVQVGSTPGTPWVRITLTSQPLYTDEGQDWDGSVPPGFVDQYGEAAFLCGETEDHCGTIQLFDREGSEERDIKCKQDDEDETPRKCGPVGEFHLASYEIDISTGFDNALGQQMSVYDEDDHWTVTQIPGQGTVDEANYALQAHPAWHQPGHGQWVNPYGDQYYGPLPGWPTDFENNWWGAPTGGDYIYEAEFIVNDPNAVSVDFDFTWWRDGDAAEDFHDPLNHLSTFRYYEDTPGSWVDVSTGIGYRTAEGTPVTFTDTTVQNEYKFEVTVPNHITFLGLLVEGTATVHCDRFVDPNPWEPVEWVGNWVDDLIFDPFGP